MHGRTIVGKDAAQSPRPQEDPIIELRCGRVDVGHGHGRVRCRAGRPGATGGGVECEVREGRCHVRRCMLAMHGPIRYQIHYQIRYPMHDRM